VIPSALAYMAACAGVYRLARHWLRPAPSALALAFFALNPNLLYLQTTAMTEPLFLCEMVWVVVWLVKWRTSLDADQGKAHRLLWLIAVVLAAAVFTRYDGWVMALVVWACMGLVLLRRGRLRSWSFWLASMLVVAAPVTWFVYNAVSFGDWLYFARGPYSANAIEIRTASHGAGPPHPGWHNPWVAELFFIKVAEMDAVAAAWGNVLLAVSFLGMVWAWLTARRRGLAWALLLWFPVPFYAYSVAYGAVPIFLPPWWPHSWYNTRYGMEMLPAFALGLGFAAQFALAAVNEFKPR
jgi:4-amino-4-deoxy-L-arabinose transferase-like glycosyltransferase